MCDRLCETEGKDINASSHEGRCTPVITDYGNDGEERD
jgi:hypothetical protein